MVSLSEPKPLAALPTTLAAQPEPDPERDDPEPRCADPVPSPDTSSPRGAGTPPRPAAAAAAVVDVISALSAPPHGVAGGPVRLMLPRRGRVSGTASLEGTLRGGAALRLAGSGAPVGADALRRTLMAEYELLRAVDLAFGWSEVSAWHGCSVNLLHGPPPHHECHH